MIIVCLIMVELILIKIIRVVHHRKVRENI